MTDIETDSKTEFDNMADAKWLNSLAGSTRRYSVYDVRPDLFQVQDDRRLLESLLAWTDMLNEDRLDMLEGLLAERSTGPTLNQTDQRVLYLLMIYASIQAKGDKYDAIHLGGLCRDAVVFEGNADCVSEFLFNLLGSDA